MNFFSPVFATFFLGLCLAFVLPPVAAPAQENSAQDSPAINRQAQVSILCYHDFTDTGTATPMRIRVEEFREQMQALKDAGVKVISMNDFLAWRRDELELPKRSILITIDDGWRSVYEQAFPVLKEFGYPFTLYLFKDFVDIGGLSLSQAEILSMMEHGCTLGAHSISHPSPQTTLGYINQEDGQAYQAFLTRELLGSKEFLETRFQTKITTYAYPYGVYDNQMRDFGLQQAGFEELFTVNPARAAWDEPRGEVSRFVIHGDDPSNFERATTFYGVPLGGAQEHQGIQLFPRPDSTISDRLPLIEAKLSSVPNLDPESLILRIDGLGQVPASYDAESKTIYYALRKPLRSRETQVFLSWKRQGSAERDPPLRWSFRLNRQARYQPFALPLQSKKPTHKSLIKQKSNN